MTTNQNNLTDEELTVIRKAASVTKWPGHAGAVDAEGVQKLSQDILRMASMIDDLKVRLAAEQLKVGMLTSLISRDHARVADLIQQVIETITNAPSIEWLRERTNPILQSYVNKSKEEKK